VTPIDPASASDLAPRDLAAARLAAQRLTGAPFPTPQAAVRSLLAVQSQDYPNAKWGVAQRTDGATEADLDRAFDAGAIVRTHVLRPTWIFVRDMENGTIERPIAAGESFDFESQPTYLAVGTTDAELTIGGAPVDVARFVTNGQIRIRAGDFDALVQGASPIPAPTAAAR